MTTIALREPFQSYSVLIVVVFKLFIKVRCKLNRLVWWVCGGQRIERITRGSMYFNLKLNVKLDLIFTFIRSILNVRYFGSARISSLERMIFNYGVVVIIINHNIRKRKKTNMYKRSKSHIWTYHRNIVYNIAAVINLSKVESKLISERNRTTFYFQSCT